jgi:hypothetical protein
MTDHELHPRSSMTDLTGARITSLRTEGGRTYAAQPATVTHASSMDAARAALLGRMRRAGHTPGQAWIGEVAGPSPFSLLRGAGYVCRNCLCCWTVIERESGPGWSIDAIRPCTRPQP